MCDFETNDGYEYKKHLVPYSMWKHSQRGYLVSLPTDLNLVPVKAVQGDISTPTGPGYKARGWKLNIYTKEWLSSAIPGNSLMHTTKKVMV